MTQATSTLTEKESALYNAIVEGMDEPNCGWLHELAYRAGFTNEHSAAGVLGSLIKKGLVESMEDDEGDELCYWVTTKNYNCGR